MLNDPQMIVGLVFLAIVYMIIQVWFIRATLDRLEQVGILIGQIGGIMFIVMNPWLLRILCLIFSFIILFLTFASCVFISRQTIILGFPSMGFFIYSLLFWKDELWIMIISSLIFMLGLIIALYENETLIGDNRLFPIFAFSLAIVGTFLIPTILPWMDTIFGITEIVGISIGIVLYFQMRAEARRVVKKMLARGKKKES